MHALMRRQGWEVGRDQIARLMAVAGVRGVKRSKKVFTTKPDPAAAKPADLVQRKFHAVAPLRLGVADITYVATWSGSAYVAFVTDVCSRRIVRWDVASTRWPRERIATKPSAIHFEVPGAVGCGVGSVRAVAATEHWSAGDHPFGDNRRVVEGNVYRYRTAVPWRGLPREVFGPWQMVWERHCRYAEDGT